MSFSSSLLLPVAGPLTVLEFHWGVVQLTSERNVPLSGTLVGQVRIVLDRLHHSALAAWMADSHKTMSGKLVVHGLDGISATRIIEFEDAYCFNQGLHFNGMATRFSTGMSILISARTLRVNGAAVLSSIPAGK